MRFRATIVFPSRVRDASSDNRLLRATSGAAAGWAFLYGLYRLYYALGGRVGILGAPVSDRQWVWINGAASVLLFMAAALSIALRPAWDARHGRSVALAVGWVIVVACVSHALIGITQRTASLAGALTIRYPFWRTIDRREADLQALFFNEPWFLVEGLLWGLLAWAGGLRGTSRRRLWFASAAIAVAIFTTIGLLSAFGVIGRTIVG